MTTYKLTYFDLTGLGEPIRLILSYMGKDFEDCRINKEDWPTKKSTTPFGKVPVLEIDGKPLHQSASICRYLAKEAGLRGKNDWEDLQIDIIVDTFQDFRTEFAKYNFEPDPVAKKAKEATFLNETIPFYMGKFDQIIKKNGGYLANGHLSWADIYVCSMVGTVSGFIKLNLTEKHPNFAALYEKVFALPKIKAWVDKRPKTI